MSAREVKPLGARRLRAVRGLVATFAIVVPALMIAAPLVASSNGELSWITGQDNLILAEGLGVGMRKSDTELKARFDKAIEDMKADGSLDALITKWLGDKAETFAKHAAAQGAAAPADAAATGTAAAAPATN